MAVAEIQGWKVEVNGTSATWYRQVIAKGGKSLRWKQCLEGKFDAKVGLHGGHPPDIKLWQVEALETQLGIKTRRS